MRPHDRDAYRLFLQATDRVVAQATCDAGALELTRESLGIDPAYAPSWVLLGWTHYNQVAACGNGGAHYQDAFAAAERAQALVAALPAALLLKSVVLVETGRVEEAYDQIAASAAARSRAFGLRFGLSESSRNHDAVLKRGAHASANLASGDRWMSLIAHFRSLR
jgi:hypothetical protein